MIEYCTKMVYPEKEVLDDIGNKPYDPMVDGKERPILGEKKYRLPEAGGSI